MPLHLLPKKSWNPYAPAAIARVKADEAEAEAREQARLEAADEYDAAVRAARLRGISPPPPPPELTVDEGAGSGQRKRVREDDHAHKNDRKRMRKLPGEDDTDRDIRLAKMGAEEAKAEPEGQLVRVTGKREDRNAPPIVDQTGHIQLFAPEDLRPRKNTEKNAEAEGERKKREREFEDQYTMRFSNAAGYNHGIKDSPWYAGSEASNVKGNVSRSSGRNAFGKEDASREKRDEARLNTADPMAAMKAAQSRFKEVERERESARRERERQLETLVQEQEREAARHGRKKGREEPRNRFADDVGELDVFSLDAQDSDKRRSRERHRDERPIDRKHHRHDRHHNQERDRRIRGRHDHSHSPGRSRHRSHHR